MKVKRITGGQLDTNCYLVISDKGNDAVLIDPGFYDDELERILAKHKDIIRAVLLTHMHFDHILGLSGVKSMIDCVVYLHKADADAVTDAHKNCYSLFYGKKIDFSVFKPDILISHGEKLCFGEITVDVIHTPGHSMGSVCFLIGDCLFTGDTLFKCSVGNPNFYGGDAEVLLKSVKELSALSGDFCVFPGHGEDSTLIYEKQFNPYMRNNYGTDY